MRGKWQIRARAFTLVELLVVVAILTVLLALLLPSFGNAMWAARHVRCTANLRQQAMAFNTYALDHSGWYPHPNVRKREKHGTAYHLQPIGRVHNGFVGGVGDIFYPYLPVLKETDAQIDRYRSKAKTAAMNHPIMRCPEAEHLFKHWRKEIPGGGLTNFENNQSYNFYANCSSGVDTGTIRLTPGQTDFAPVDPRKMLQKNSDTMVMRTDDGPTEYTILSSDIILGNGNSATTWHGRGRYGVRPKYYNLYYFYDTVVPNYSFVDGSVRQFRFDYAYRRDLMHTSQKTQGISGDAYLLPQDWGR
jgi:prepilin-type N-terminal cleavage/methylation domain-containing protein